MPSVPVRARRGWGAKRFPARKSARVSVDLRATLDQRVRRAFAGAGDCDFAVIGYGKASKIAHYAVDNDLTLKAAALKLGFVSEAEFDRVEIQNKW
jgi:hypothetical protein